tara:strand:- start:471 stop:1028 length:558 start_codon:yes stop_codon:yes gene_type:complete
MEYLGFAVIASNTISGDTTISDLLNEKELDVTSLKQDAPGEVVREHVDGDEAFDQRADELSQIQNFIKTHGVTRPTEEDYKPKSQKWSRNIKTKAEKLAENPNYVERRGRPRSSYTKAVTFVRVLQADKGLIDNDGKDQFKRAGRGRAKKGEIRESFTLHHSNVSIVSEGIHTRKQLEALIKKAS